MSGVLPTDNGGIRRSQYMGIPVNKFVEELKKTPTLIEIADDGKMPF